MKFRDFLLLSNFYKEGVYISRKLTESSVIELTDYLSKYLPDCILEDNLHCTIIYSAKSHKYEIKPNTHTIETTPVKFSKFGDNDILVLELSSDELIKRNKELTDQYGFTSDYSDYKPHCTLAYNAEHINITELPPIQFNLTFDTETTEQLSTE